MPRKQRRSSALHRPEHSLVAQMIRDEREKQNLSQAEVAVRVGKPQSWVAKTEAGGRRLDVVELVTLLAAMGVNVDAFMRRLRQKILNKD